MNGMCGKWKKALAMLLSILMLVSVLPVSVLAETGSSSAGDTMTNTGETEPTASPEPESSLPPVDAALKLDTPFEGVLKKGAPQITFRLKVSRKMDLQLTFAGAVAISLVHEQDETTCTYSGVQAEDGSWSELTKVFKSKQGSWFITVTALEEAFVDDQPIAFSLIFTQAPEVPGESEPTPEAPEEPGEPEPTPEAPEVPGEPEPTPEAPEEPGEPEPTPEAPEVPGEPEPTPEAPEVPGEPEPTPEAPEEPGEPEPTPEVPEVPGEPEPTPEAPEAPGEPEPTPEAPEEPGEPEPTPEAPEAPGEPEPTPVAPEVPGEPEPTPEVPEVPGEPEPTPEAPEVPGEPEPTPVAPEVPGEPEPTPGEPEVPGEPEPTPEAPEVPGEPEPTPVAPEVPGEPEPMPEAPEEPGEPEPTPEAPEVLGEPEPTPEAPEVPGEPEPTPVTPEEPGEPEPTPEAPEVPGEPEPTPEAPEVPGEPEPTPAAPEVPGEPEPTPEAPEVPGEPEPTPEAPEVPGEPEPTPEAPEVPGEPEPTPEAPEEPGEPEPTPEAPEVPGEPEPTPEAPEAPGEPEPTPEAPEVPGEPEPTPEAPEVPGEPEPTPEAPEVPGEPEPTPEAPEEPGEPEPTPAEPEVPGEPEPTPVVPEAPGEPEPTPVAPEAPGEPEPTPVTPEVPGEPEPTPVAPEAPGEPEPTPEVPEVPGEPEPTPEAPEVPGEPEPTPVAPEAPGEPEPTPEVPEVPGEPEPPAVIEHTFADEYDYVQLLNLLTDNGIYASAIDEVTADDPDALEIDYQIGDYMIVPAALFDTVTVTVLTREGETYTILFHNPGPDEDDPQETDGMVIDPADFMELSGKLPKNAVVDIEPVTVDIEGQRTLAAFDIKIYANKKQKEQGKTWQPADKKVTVRWQDKAFASRTLDIYHLADGAEPERVASVEAKDGWVEFEADSFSVYAVTETILTQTITTSDGATYEIKVTYTDEAGLPMEGTALQVAEIKADDKAFASYLNECARALGVKAENLDFARAFDIKIVDAKDPDKVLMPQAEVDVAITLVDAALDSYANVDVLHFVNLRKSGHTAQELKSDVDGETVTFATNSFSVYMVAAYTLETLIEASDGNTYRIAVTYDENAGIPLEGVELQVREITADSDEYAFYLDESVKALGTDVDHVALSRAFDIKIVDAADKTHIYEPQNNVSVSITLVGAALTDYANVDVLHFEDTTAKAVTVSQMESAIADDTVSFATGSFSVYMVIGHENQAVVNPRVMFHFISHENVEEKSDGTNIYYKGAPYTFSNKHNETQTTQILKNGESLELITDPVNQNDSYFYGWYVVEPHIISGTTDDYGIGTADQKLYYTWPATPDRITFESPISITATGVSIGSTVSWSLNGVSASGSVDANGDVHVFLAPLFERYHFVNFMLRPRNTTGSNNLMTRKLIAMGSADSVEVKISDIRSNSTDPVHLVFTGWEYYDAASGQWITKQTVDYDGSALADSGKDGVYFSVSLTGSESVDLYPVFIEARWVDFFAGVSGSGAAYVASRFLESWGRATATNPPVDTPDKNVFTDLEVSTRTGYAFDGWYAFAKTNSTTGEITNLTGSEAVEITYLTLDGEGDYVPHTVTVTTTAVKIANADGTINNSGYWSITDNGDGTGTLNNNDSGHKLLQTADGKLRFFDPLDRLTLSAKWAPVNSQITVVYWTENAQDKNYFAPSDPKADYTASAVKVITTADLNTQSSTIGATFGSGSTITISQLGSYTDGSVRVLDRTYLDDIGAVLAGEEKFYDLNTTLSNTSVVIKGDGSTTFNVYFERKTFKIVFHIGRDNYVKNGGHQKTDVNWDGNWIEFMYKDSKVTALGYPTPGAPGRNPADSISGVFRMEYLPTHEVYTSEYVTTKANVMGYYDPDPAVDTNLYVIKAKYGAYIGDRWPSHSNPNFSFSDATGKNKTLYIWAAYYGSLYCRIANERSTVGNPQGANPDINGVYEYMSAELCSNRAGDAIINANQVHHLVAYYGNSNNDNRFKQYHILYEAIPGTYDPAQSTVSGDNYLTYNLTTWSQEHTVGDKSEISGHTFIEITGSPQFVISNLEPQFQLTDSIDGYEQIYSCYNPVQQPNNDDPSQNDYHIYFFFAPKQYTLTFNFGSTTKADTYYYTQTLADADKYTGDVVVPEGYYFAGWYINAEGVGDPFDFANEKMPSQNVVLYPVLKPIQLTVKIDPNGGVIDHRANASTATYFTANYGTPVGEYTTKREYIKLTDKELTPGDQSYYSGVKYYYINTRRLGIPSEGDWGLPTDLRNAVYVSESDLETYYNWYVSTIDSADREWWTGITALSKEDFIANYTSYPYRPIDSGGEHYTFMGWYQVFSDGSVASMPYNFNDPVKDDLELRALWRLDGGYYIQYNPYYFAESGGVVTAIVGEVQQWTDPENSTMHLYADQSPTHILKAPTNVTNGWVFRGWRVVRKNGTKTYTDSHGTNTYDNWESFGDPNYYQPGDAFTIDSALVTETNSTGKVIHMQAYYEPESSTYRRPDVTNLTLDANDVIITGVEHGGYVDSSVGSLPVFAGPGSVYINTADNLDSDRQPTQILFGDIQSNIALHLYQYATSSTHNGVQGKEFFVHHDNYLLLGFDEESDPEVKHYIPTYAADSVIAVTRDDDVTLYALWEPMVYVTFVNTTDEPITVNLTGIGSATVSIVNQVTGEFDREATTTQITIPAKSSGGQNGQVKIVLPGARPDDDSFTATARNTHLRKKMSVSGEFQPTSHGTGGGPVKYGNDVTYTGILKTDPTGIIVTYTEEDDRQVVFNVNGGTWTATSPDYVHASGDEYTLDEDKIHNNAYEPSDPTKSPKLFIGWVTGDVLNKLVVANLFQDLDAVLANTDWSGPTGGVTIDNVAYDNCLEYLKANKWDFTRTPPFGQILYAVWSDAVTVTFDIVRNGSNLHQWQGPNTTQTNTPYEYYRSSSTSGVITYTLAKGERVPRPSDPTTDQTNWRFVAWLLNYTNYRNATKQPSDTNIRNKTYDFTQRVTNNITLSTSWTTNQPQTFTFKVRNEVVNGNDGDEFTYTITVSDVKLLAKISGQNQVVDPSTNWGSISTQLKNNEEYTVIATVSYNTDGWFGNSVNVEVIDKSGVVIKTGQLMVYPTQSKSNFTSDYKYTFTITQAEKSGYTTTVGTKDLVGSIVFDPPDNTTRSFAFKSSESRTPSSGATGAVTNAAETFNNPEVNNYATGKTSDILVDFTHSTNGKKDTDYYTHPGDNSLTVVFTNTAILYPSPTGVSFRLAPFALLMATGVALMPAMLPRRRRKEED